MSQALEERFVGKKIVSTRKRGNEVDGDGGVEIECGLVDDLLQIGGVGLVGFYTLLSLKDFGNGRGKDFVPEFCKKCKISRREFDRYMNLLVSHGVVERVPTGEEGGAADA